MHCVCCFRWCRYVLSWTFVVWLEFVSLVSWIVPPLHRFCAVTYNRQLQTRHIGRWPTCIKFWCKVDVHWFSKLFWPIRTGRILQAWKWLEICKCQWEITPHQCSTISFAGNKLTSFMSSYPYFLETLCPYFEKYGRTSVLSADFHTDTGKNGRVGSLLISILNSAPSGTEILIFIAWLFQISMAPMNPACQVCCSWQCHMHLQMPQLTCWSVMMACRFWWSRWCWLCAAAFLGVPHSTTVCFWWWYLHAQTSQSINRLYIFNTCN